MTDQSLREALEALSEDYATVDAEQLRDLLAAHPAEPAPHNTSHPVGRRSVTGIHHADDCPMRTPGMTGCICGREGERDSAPAGVEITDEAAVVEAIARTQIIGTWEQKTERERGVHLRRAQRAWEAARPFMTAVTVRPALDHDKVSDAIGCELGPYIEPPVNHHVAKATDAVMALAVPVPTSDDLDALLWEHRVVASNGTQSVCACDRKWRSDTEHRTHLRNGVLALLNGSAK